MEIFMYLLENLIFPLFVALIIKYMHYLWKVIFLFQALLLIVPYIKNYIRFFNNFSSH